MERFDVLVVGGGTAGIIAALQASRAGAKTLLVEKNEILGGTIFNSNIKIPGLFHAWEKQVIAGIGWELVEKTVKEGNGVFPDFEHPCPHLRKHRLQQVEINTALFSMIAEEELRKAGCAILLDTMVGAIRDGEEKEITLCGKEGLSVISAAVIVDCTGDANVIRMANFPVERSEEIQPGTYVCNLDGYDSDTLDMDEIARAYGAEVAAGRLRYTDISWNAESFSPGWIRHFGQNANHVDCRGIDPETSAGRTEIAASGRQIPVFFTVYGRC
ncbi:MAG: FAD-dependent oxidoreductase, partial [Clostridia bacterium]|nr:FAD-dependent oxidoreductase [Clostridia bacterium]